jgi:hypothetical protein
MYLPRIPGAAWLMAGDPPGQPRVRDDGWIKLKAGDAEMKSWAPPCSAPFQMWLEPH